MPKGEIWARVCFQDADIKFFLEADVNVRAHRRQQQLAEKGQTVRLETVRDEMVLRDTRDRNRENDPLRPASEAIMIETSEQPLQNVVERMTNMIMERL